MSVTHDDDTLESILGRLRADPVETARLRQRRRRALNKDELDPSYRIKEISCSGCGRTFFAHAGHVSYCSPACQQADRNDRRREQRALERAERDPKPRPCAVCGNKMVDQVRSTRRYCSKACRQQAYRDRARH